MLSLIQFLLEKMHCSLKRIGVLSPLFPDLKRLLFDYLNTGCPVTLSGVLKPELGFLKGIVCVLVHLELSGMGVEPELRVAVSEAV